MSKILALEAARLFEQIIGWPYVSPGTNDQLGIDCSGAWVRVYRAYGLQIDHGSNSIYRKFCSQTGALTSVSQLQVGMAVFKHREDNQEPIDRLAPVLPGVLRVMPPTQGDRLHQTQKPLELMSQLVQICETGGTILDPFCGSGTTIHAAALAGYSAVGIEYSQHYTEVTQSRLRDAGYVI